MSRRRIPFVAREGLPFLGAALLAIAASWRYGGAEYLVISVPVFLWLLAIFRDPLRLVPAMPLGVVSPVDGRIVDVSVTDKSALNSEAHRITIRIESMGTYTARSPVEGKIMDFHTANADLKVAENAVGLWVQTDEKDDVVLQFQGHRFGIPPRASVRFGERVGQGQRCAYLRLTRLAEVQLPINSRVMVAKGDRVRAGADVLAKLPHP